MTVSIGLRVPVSSPVTSRDRIIEVAIEADRLGYDALFVQDHIHKSFEKHRASPPGTGSLLDPTNTSDPMMFETVATLAYLAAVTSKVELGVGVTPLLLREPALFAKQCATLDVLSGGRFILGVGVSNVTDRPEFEALKLDFPPYSVRYDIASSYVTAMRRIWEESRASYTSEHVAFEDLIVYPKPARRIPVWLGSGPLVGSGADVRLKFALEHCDGYIPPYVTTAAEITASRDAFRAAAEGLDRDTSDFVWCAQRRVAIGPDRADALAQVAWMEREQGDMWKYAGYLQGKGAEGTSLNTSMASVGNPEDIRAALAEYIAAGANHIEIAFVYPNHDSYMRQMRLFAEEVMPALR